MPLLHQAARALGGGGRGTWLNEDEAIWGLARFSDENNRPA